MTYQEVQAERGAFWSSFWERMEQSCPTEKQDAYWEYFFDNLSAASKAGRVHNIGNLREAYPQVYEKIGYYIEYKLNYAISEDGKAELLRYISTNFNKRKVHNLWQYVDTLSTLLRVINE